VRRDSGIELGHHERNLRDLEWIAGLLEVDGIVTWSCRIPAGGIWNSISA
jgi:hypothetical protein